jgi:predicted CopG family antitoxin
MQRKLTITLNEEIYEGLHKVIGRRKISQFIEDLVRPHVTTSELEAGYAAMAANEAREAEALEWSEGTVGDSAHETR